MTEAAAPVAAKNAIAADLIAVLVAVTAGDPRVLTIKDQSALPSGPFELAHRSLQSGLRAWVERQTRLPLGYVEQLYTFADRDRGGAGQHVISISYLGLTREQLTSGEYEVSWRSWYSYFPWEDHRDGSPAMIEADLLPRLSPGPERDGMPRRGKIAASASPLPSAAMAAPGTRSWSCSATNCSMKPASSRRRHARPARHGAPRDRGRAASWHGPADDPRSPAHSRHRHREARAKIKYRPVVFELMPETFTLLQLQRCVEALAGRLVHKQNFRRLIEQQELVEETGETTPDTGGRPAKLFRFRREVLPSAPLSEPNCPFQGLDKSYTQPQHMQV